MLDKLFDLLNCPVKQLQLLENISKGQSEIFKLIKEIKMQANEFELQLAGIQTVFEKAFAEIVEEVAGLQAEIVAAQNANAQLPESLVARAANLSALAQKFDNLNADKVVEEVPAVETPVEEVPAPMEAPIEVAVPVEEVPAEQPAQ